MRLSHAYYGLAALGAASVVVACFATHCAMGVACAAVYASLAAVEIFAGD